VSVREVQSMFHHQILGGGSLAVNSAYIWYLNVYKETEEAFNSVERRLFLCTVQECSTEADPIFSKEIEKKTTAVFSKQND